MELSYVKIKSAQYMARLLKKKIYAVRHSQFYEFIEWLGVRPKDLLKHIIKTLHKEFPDDTEAIDALEEAYRWPSRRISREFNELTYDFPSIHPIIRDYVLKECEKISRFKIDDKKTFKTARKNISNIFGLSRHAINLTEFAYIYDSEGYVESYFDIFNLWKPQERKILAYILNTNIDAVNVAIQEVEACGIFKIERYSQDVDFSNSGIKFFERPAQNPNDFFCVLVKGETLPLETFNVSREDLDYVTRLLTSKSSAPVHIMLYGPPGTGKTTFARSLARALKLKAWSANINDDDAGGDRIPAVIACMNIASRHSRSFVLIDEAEKFLDTSIREKDDTKDKSWLNSLLERPNQRVIWITNHVEHIHPSVMRRFSFSIFFEAPGRKEREKLFTGIISRHKAGKYFTSSQIKSLAKNYEVPAAVIESSIARAETLEFHDKEFASAVELSMKAYTTFLRAGEKVTRKSGDEVKNFTLDGITLDGARISDLITRCKRADDAMRNPKIELEGGCATMLFYGPPGTGKTALARHIAHELDRECQVVRASDLLDCYLGETEKKIAEAFKHAEEEGAVLVIDEADTFLFSRDMAVRSWEVSQVNEFLVNLEECKTFCICTTNRLKELDAASVRRFSYKVAFDYSGPEQIIALYNSLLRPLCECELTPELERELRSFTRLTPGDFHAVRAQYNSFLSDETTANHEELVRALRREMSLKNEKISAGYKISF